MEDIKKIEIITDIIHISENYTSFFDEGANCRYIQIKGVCFWVKNYEEHYKPVLNTIFREMKLGKRFSSDYVKEFIDILISDTLTNGIENVKKNPLIIDNFEDKFQEVLVYIPLEGIKIEKEFKLGSITFKKITNDIYEKWVDKTSKCITSNPYFKNLGEEETIKTIKFCEDYLRGYNDKICAEFKLFAEEDIAIDYAKKECSRSLDLLQFSSYFFYHIDYRVSVGLAGELKKGYQNIFAHREDFQGYKFKTNYIGSFYEFEITEPIIKHMKKIGIFNASQILEKSMLTDFEEIIILGIHWFANSLTQTEIENKFLSLMISLELFLTPGGGEPISQSISESIAIILESELENRKILKEHVKNFYSKRSAIVHGRRNDIPNKEDIQNLLNITAHLILWMVKKSKEFNRKKDLLNYLENLRLA